MMNRRNRNNRKIAFKDYIGTPIVFWAIFNIPVMLWFQNFGPVYVIYAIGTFLVFLVYAFIGTKLNLWPFTDSLMRDE